MAAAAPLYITDYKGRSMAEGNDEGKQAYIERCNFFRLVRQVLSPSEYLVFDVIRDATGSGWYWLSFNELIWRTGGLTKPCIAEAIERLEGLELIQVKRHPRQTQEANEYLAIKDPDAEVTERLEKAFGDMTASKKSLLALHRASKKSLPVASKENLPGLVKNLYSNVEQSTDKSNDLTTAKAVGAIAPAPAKSIPKPEASQPKPLKPTISQDAETVIQHWATLQKTRPKGADDSWFELLAQDFPLDRVLAGLTLAKEYGFVQTAAQVRKTIQNMDAKERAQFDDKGKRIRSNGNEYRQPYTPATKTNGFSRSYSPGTGSGAVNANDPKYQPGGKYYTPPRSRPSSG